LVLRSRSDLGVLTGYALHRDWEQPVVVFRARFTSVNGPTLTLTTGQPKKISIPMAPSSHSDQPGDWHQGRRRGAS